MSVPVVTRLGCTCRQDGHRTSLPTTWFQFLTQEQWLQLHGTEPQRFRWRTSCMLQKASSSACYASFTVQNTILTAKSSGAFVNPSDLISACALHGPRNRVPYCFVLRAVQRICRLLQRLSETMLLPCWWSDDYLCVCAVWSIVLILTIVVYFYLNGLNHISSFISTVASSLYLGIVLSVFFSAFAWKKNQFFSQPLHKKVSLAFLDFNDASEE